MIEKIISILLLLFMIIIGGTIFYTVTIHNTGASMRLEQNHYEQLYAKQLLKSLLESTENETQETYRSLIVTSMIRMNETIMIHGKQINVTKKIKDSLDVLLDDYYFRIEPKNIGVAISYIFDGSETMREKRSFVNRSMPQLINSLRQEDALGTGATITSFFYVLNDGLCNEFVGAPAQCQEIQPGELYDFIKNESLQPPIIDGKTYDQWMSMSHVAEPITLSESDWASGVAYASHNFWTDPNLVSVRLMTPYHFIVVLADELASSSKADSCFLIKSTSHDPSRDMGRLEWNACNLCNNSCPTNRSLRLVNQTHDYLSPNDYVIGFYTKDCDYDYNEERNAWSTDPYICRYADDTANCQGDANRFNIWQPKHPISWCEQDACGGCEPPSVGDTTPSSAQCRSNGGCYCFHKNCQDIIPEHMNVLVGVNDPQPLGEVHQLQNISQLTDVIKTRIREIYDKIYTSIGTRDSSRNRAVAEETTTLKNGEQIVVSLWVYK